MNLNDVKVALRCNRATVYLPKTFNGVYDMSVEQDKSGTTFTLKSVPEGQSGYLTIDGARKLYEAAPMTYFMKKFGSVNPDKIKVKNNGKKIKIFVDAKNYVPVRKTG